MCRPATGNPQRAAPGQAASPRRSAVSARQLALPFPHQAGFAAADFIRAASNEAASAWLERTGDWPDHRLALWGPAGCGKTHLLHLWSARTGAALLDGPSLRGLPPPPARGVAIDDADLPAEEPALLHLLNACREARLPVLLAAISPPARWRVALPDLASRLRAVTAIEIEPPDDALLEVLLARLLADRQLTVTPALQAWLLSRLPRTPAALREVVARLDRAALAAGGRISRMLAAAVLATAGFDDTSTEAGTPPCMPGENL
jgi:chromosomal replication initiation ATPase DnaA